MSPQRVYQGPDFLHPHTEEEAEIHIGFLRGDVADPIKWRFAY